MARVKVIRVGDHTPEPTAAADPYRSRIQAELWAVRKMRPSLEEYRALQDRYADATRRMQIALTNEDFPGVRSAWLSLEEIADLTKFLNTGIMHAIEACQRREF